MWPIIVFQKVLIACRDDGQGNQRDIFRGVNCLTC